MTPKSTGTDLLQTRYYGIHIFVDYDNQEYWLVTSNGGDEYIGHMPPTPAQIESFRRVAMEPARIEY